MHDMRVLTVRKIREIEQSQAVDQDSQDLIERLTSLTGENARQMRSLLKTAGNTTRGMYLVGAITEAENTT